MRRKCVFHRGGAGRGGAGRPFFHSKGSKYDKKAYLYDLDSLYWPLRYAKDFRSRKKNEGSKPNKVCY